MCREVVISKVAEKKLDKLIIYLANEWSEKIKNDFIEKLESVLKIIRTQSQIFPESVYRKGLRKSVITKQTTQFYRYNSKRINIVTLFDKRQNPKKIDKEI